MGLRDKQCQWKHRNDLQCYELLNVVYCNDVKVPELQCMNIYVPEAYFKSDMSKNIKSKVGKFTSLSAPIVFENSIGGYSEAAPETIDNPWCKGKEFLNAGMIYISVGARGKQTVGEHGEFIGKAPIGLVDLKAAIRFIKHNRECLPGDVNKIISVGVSAGGAMSSLLGCTGNSEEYLSLLEESGAMMEETDDIYGAQCYCPIIDLSHGDIAYEWMFSNVTNYKGMGHNNGGELTPFQEELSKVLKFHYPSYFNSLSLVNPDTLENLIIGNDYRSGSAYEYLLSIIEKAAEKHLKLIEKNKLNLKCTVEDYLKGNYTYKRHHGKNVIEIQGIDKTKWLTYDGTKVKITSLDDMIKYYLPRLKSCPAFDSLENNQPENQVFGDETTDYLHFDNYVLEAIEKLKPKYPEEYNKYFRSYEKMKGDNDLQYRVEAIDPFIHIGTERQGKLAPYYRIRVGTRDAHTSFTMAMILALKLEETKETKVDYAMVWDEDHGPADYAGELCQWINSIC
ncbi:Hypothetical protein CM240_0590 [Clostridium bornimense]|uniref:BD-FAE-like domain-containing protein n=1 Tax=Clostridium bornimense TaxID=1216932 RepID=W6SDM4_9CLOT|nr:subtype B tannase [Clostridium bornimense]CDM67755.1 Hypothetical protein CM240_0590 [Clostridium bornimense]